MAGVLDARKNQYETGQEPLELIPEGSFADLYNVLLEDVPHSLSALGMINNLSRWRGIPSTSSNQKLYAPFGNFENGVCVGIYDTDSFQAVTFYTPDVNDRKLREACLKTGLIKWTPDETKEFLVMEIPLVLAPIVDEVATDRNLKAVHDPAFHFWMEKERAIKLRVSCPPGVKLRPLTTDHIPYLDQFWPHRFNGSQEYLKTLLQRNFGIGAFFEGIEMPVAWVVLNQNSCMTMLYVLETHRRNGYAQLVCNAMAKKMAEMGVYPRATVVQNNYSSKALFEKMGYQLSHVVDYIELRIVKNFEP